MSESHDGRVLERVRVDRITASRNVRSEFGDVESLAASIRTHGVLTPLLLRRVGDEDRFEIVAGERRFRAAQLAGLVAVPAQIETAENPGAVEAEAQRIAEQLAENEHRLDLTPAEQMQGVQQLLELGLSDDDVATRTGNEPAQVAAMRSVLALPAAARALIDEGALSLDAAVQLAATQDEEIVGRALTLIGEGYHPDSAVTHARDEVTQRRILEDARAKLARDGIPEIDPPAGYSFSRTSKTRVLGAGYDCLHVPVKKHRRMPCHAAYVNRWARSARDAIVWVCTDVTRHAADADAGVPEAFLRPSESVKQERAARRVQKKAWRESHDGRRAIATQLLGELDRDAAIARLAGEVFAPDAGDMRVAEMAAALLGHPVADDDAALQWLDERWRAAAVDEQLRVAVAWLTARAELAMGKEHGDWHEHENVRAHFALLSAHGYEVGEGEQAHLERAFQLDGLERPAPRRWAFGADARDLENADAEADGTEDAASLEAEADVEPEEDVTAE